MVQEMLWEMLWEMLQEMPWEMPCSQLTTPGSWHSFAELPGLSLPYFPPLGDIWGRVSSMLGQDVMGVLPG